MPTYYLTNTDLVSLQYEKLDTTAPATPDEAQGWTVDKKASPNYCVYKPDTTCPSGDFVTTEPGAFSLSGYRTQDPITGQFVSGIWTLYGKVKCNTYYAQKGRVKFRLWRSSNADGSSATQITPGWQQSAQIGFTAANQYQTFSIVWTAGNAVSLDNEYLFLEIEWSAEVSGGNNAAAVYWVHNEGAAERLDTPTLTVIHNLAISGAQQNQEVFTITLGQNHQLAITGSEHSQESRTPVLIQVSQLVILDSEHQQESPTLTLSERHNLALIGAQHLQESQTLNLGQRHFLDISGMTQEHRADVLALAQLHRLLIAGAVQIQESPILSLKTEQEEHCLVILAAFHDHKADQIQIRALSPMLRPLDRRKAQVRYKRLKFK